MYKLKVFMQFPKLYKKNANGSINEWRILTKGNTYWTEFGRVGGQIQASEKTLCFGKNIGKVNETSAERQAELEAASIWRRKISMENFVLDIDNVNKVKFNPPMLAKIYNKKYDKTMRFVQPKLDGIRCNIALDGDKIEAISRRNKPFFSVEHIKKSLEKFIFENPSIHLDGELYNHELHDDFNKIVSLVKKQKMSSEDENEIVKYVKYYVYDMWDDNHPDLTFSERNRFINDHLKELPFVEIVETYEVSSSEDIDDRFKEFIAHGYEGAIIRLDKPYEHKRSKNLLKYKEFLDDEFEILSVNRGKTNNMAESVTIRLKNGNICNATLAFTDDKCIEMMLYPDFYVKKMATVRYFGETNDGMLRFPVVKSINRDEYE